MARGSSIEFAPVGGTLQNGYDLGGARIYPFSTGLAIEPPAQYNNYIGDPTGNPAIQSPVGSMAGAGGASSAGSLSVLSAKSSPFDFTKSPLPWVVLGLFGAVLAMHQMHYKK
jgi:hypothetical protein